MIARTVTGPREAKGDIDWLVVVNPVIDGLSNTTSSISANINAIIVPITLFFIYNRI